LGLGPTEYFEQTRGAVSLTDFFIGVSKSMVFGILVALVGCLRGMQSGRSAAAVGLAATSAVVTSIVLIIVIDGVFAVILNVLHPYRRAAGRAPARSTHPRGRPHDGLRELRHTTRPLLHDRQGRDLRHHGRKREREEHAAQSHGRPSRPRQGRRPLRRAEL